MREINLNGYIDDDVWFGDEITPGILHDELYPDGGQPADDIRIILNSYGGSCTAATRMYDELTAYPGNVHIIISGTAASAATVLASAANRLEMTPGSLFMIHDPSMGVYGNAADLKAALDMLDVCKESILNIYCQRCAHGRNEIADLMTATTWMDAKAAKEYGFIDGIVTAPMNGISDAAFERTVHQADVEKKVEDWLNRHKSGYSPENLTLPENTSKEENISPEENTSTIETEAIAENQPSVEEPKIHNEPEPVVEANTTTGSFISADQLRKRLDLLKPHDIF